MYLVSPMACCRFRGWTWLAGASLLICALYLGRHPLLVAAGKWLDIGQPPRPCDFVLILTGEPNSRPFVAAESLLSGLAELALVPQVAPAPEQAGILPPEHETIRKVLVHLGVAENRVAFLEGNCRSTFDEAIALRKFLTGHPKARVTVVTNDFHTRRARLVFRSVLGNSGADLQFVSAPYDGAYASCWWQHENAFATYGEEYLKLVYYALRYDRTTAAIVLLAFCGMIGLTAHRLWRKRCSRLAAA